MTQPTNCQCGHDELSHGKTACLVLIEGLLGAGITPFRCPCKAFTPPATEQVSQPTAVCECGHGKNLHLFTPMGNVCDECRINGNADNCPYYNPVEQVSTTHPAPDAIEGVRLPIALPVSYDGESNGYIRDADGCIVAEISAWQYNWPAQGGKPTDEITPAHGHAVGQQIANALNRGFYDKMEGEAESASNTPEPLTKSNN